MSELRFALAEKFYQLENKQIDTNDAKTFAAIASGIVNSCKVEVLNNHLKGITKEIDYLDYQNESNYVKEPKKGETYLQ